MWCEGECRAMGHTLCHQGEITFSLEIATTLDGDVIKAAEIIEPVIVGRLWDKPEYFQRSAVI
jgi:hypothetical protein